MRRAWLAVAFAGAVAAAVVWTDSGRAQQTPPAEPQVPAEAVADEPAGEPQEAEASPCAGVAMQSDRRGGVLAAVPRYGSTYVLVVPSRLAESVPNASAPAVKGLHVGVQGESAAGDVARSLGMTNIEEYPLRDSAPLQLLQDVRDEKLDAAVLWAPLAGLAIVDLGLDGMVSVFTVDKPHPAPPSLRSAATPDPCAVAIAEELDVNGVLPAELLVSVDIRDMLDLHPPKFDLARAQEGAAVFNETCARCHGPDAVADPHGLAPVDLRLSIRRFSYPGYRFIVMNGRPSKSMPPFRGTVTEEQIALIYQYLKARSDNLLTAQAAAAPAE